MKEELTYAAIDKLKICDDEIDKLKPKLFTMTLFPIFLLVLFIASNKSVLIFYGEVVRTKELVPGLLGKGTLFLKS